jgi:hypothetical protein
MGKLKNVFRAVQRSQIIITAASLARFVATYDDTSIYICQQERNCVQIKLY